MLPTKESGWFVSGRVWLAPGVALDYCVEIDREQDRQRFMCPWICPWNDLIRKVCR